MNPIGTELYAFLAHALLRLLDGGDGRDVFTSTDLHRRVLESLKGPVCDGLYELNNW
jgi:hypothetical protein